MKITPAHDFNDFEVGKRHNIAAINVLTRQAKMFVLGNDTFTPDANSLSADVKALDGLDRYDARKRIVALVHDAGYLAKVEPYASQVPHGDRSNSAIEPYLTDQWYVDAKTLAKDALDSVRAGRTKFVPENWTKTYYQWLENIEPWCVSRQLWWGHQIPAWYGPDGKVFVASNEEDAALEAEKHYGEIGRAHV